ncbi:MAG: serine hydrolase [Patescibacteria group bacterium]|nr:MAG: serine hydrolase [Patescibacteria group bacterium]
MSESFIQSLRDICTRAIARRIFPGCAIGIVMQGETNFFSFGNLTYAQKAPLVTEKTVYDIASITKVIPTSLLALKLLEEGKITLETKVQNILPEIKNNYQDKITLHHLLTQTLDFNLRLSTLKNLSPQELLSKIFHAQLRFPPGESYAYNNTTSILLGLVIERVTQKNLDVLAYEMLFQPLEMKRTTFNTSSFFPEQVAPSEIDSWRGGEIRGEVHDESAYVLSKIITPGSAGLFSTAEDLTNLLLMLTTQGIYRSKQIFTDETIQLMQINQSSTQDKTIGLGWELCASWMGTRIPKATIGKTGFTGCSILCNIPLGLGMVFLCNHTYPYRRRKKEEILSFRKELGNLLFSEI